MNENLLENCIKVEIVWIDDTEDLFELGVSVSSRHFAGLVYIYTRSNHLVKFANAIRRFPNSPHDRREFELGSFDEKYAGGGVRLQFYCWNLTGGISVAVNMRTGSSIHSHPEEGGTAMFHLLNTSASSIDEFVSQLDHMKVELGACACLR